MYRTLKRIHRLLREVKGTCGDREIPSFEQFCKEWGRMDALSKSIYKTIAECPGLLGEPDEYDKVIAGYLKRMGLVTEQLSLSKFSDRFGGNVDA